MGVPKLIPERVIAFELQFNKTLPGGVPAAQRTHKEKTTQETAVKPQTRCAALPHSAREVRAGPERI